MKERSDPHLNILLDIQKQLGTLGAETTRQSAKLEAINERQEQLTEYQKYANGKTAKVIQDVQDIKDNHNVTKGKIIIFMAVGGFLAAILSGLIVTFTRSKLGL